MPGIVLTGPSAPQGKGLSRAESFSETVSGTPSSSGHLMVSVGDTPPGHPAASSAAPRQSCRRLGDGLYKGQPSLQSPPPMQELKAVLLQTSDPRVEMKLKGKVK